LRGEELAEVMAIPPGTVRSRIRRGLELLRDAMSELAKSPQRIRTTTTNLRGWAEAVRNRA